MPVFARNRFLMAIGAVALGTAGFPLAMAQETLPPPDLSDDPPIPDGGA